MLSLNQRLNKILKVIVEFSNTIEIISINASISASKMEGEEGRVFKIIAQEIRTISSKSLEELSDLDKVLEEFKSLSEIINIAGRQRMLAQKSMKLKLLLSLEIDDNDSLKKELDDTLNLFESSHNILSKASMNNDLIEQDLSQLLLDWQAYKASLFMDTLKDANALNNILVHKMNSIVSLYQDLS